SVETIRIFNCGRAASSSGSAVSPSITGISISSTTTSGALGATSSTASLPLAWRDTASSSGSSSIQRDTNPRTTAESSTTITRIGSPFSAMVLGDPGGDGAVRLWGSIDYTLQTSPTS